MSSSEIPFYAQTAVLDRYIHSSNPDIDSETLDIILDMLRSRQDLRDYFFRSGPDAAWAPILWDHGFFAPPTPQETEVGSVLPRWDVQEYLISVADQNPDTVIKHVESLRGQGWYMGRAIQALCQVSAKDATRALSQVMEWLEDPTVAISVAWKAQELMIAFVEQGEVEASFNLFRAITAPLPPLGVRDDGEYLVRAEAVSKFRNTWYEDQVLSSGIDSLRQLDIRRVVTILEEHLCTAIQIEAEVRGSPGFEYSWWRSAIEDTEQDSDRSYKDRLLRVLRDALEAWVQQNPAAVEPFVQRYLSEEREILHRLGLHIIRRFPTEYLGYITSELQNTDNLDDVGIHHEYFLLLQEGYPHLKVVHQKTLVAAICLGSPKDLTQKLAKRAQKERGEDPTDYAQRYSQLWTRDRLWMLREHLVGEPAQVLRTLAEGLGEPKHPTFTHWHSGAFVVRDVSPITRDDLSRMSPEKLVAFLQGWKPQPDRGFGPEHVSYRGLANVLADVIIDCPQRYMDQLSSIAFYRPAFACALLDQLAQASDVPWELSLSLCEDLLTDKARRSDMGRDWDGNWVWARKSIVRLLHVGLNNPERVIPEVCLPRVRDVLLTLIDDPDPDPESDRPEEGFAGHRDPATVAINHVRSDALLALVEYAHFRAKSVIKATGSAEAPGPGPERLENVVRDALTRKLDRRRDPSWAVHSVYGRCLSLLYWLDKAWVESHIDQVFPEADDEQTIWFYVAAWDSYVIFNQFYSPMLEMLRRKYERATENLAKGYVTQTHLQPDRGLATHLTWEYLLADYDLNSPAGQQSLIATFFIQAPSEARGSPAWLLWRIGEGNLTRFAKHWPRVRSLWEWRVHEAAVANHSTDFDDEMEWFAHLPLVVPDTESITTLWPLLEGLLPHITRARDRMTIAWESVEKYLAQEVDRNPVRSMQFYRLMHEQTERPPSFYEREEARTIIETAAAHVTSRPDALSLIDSLARSGIHNYRDIYERYTR